MLEEATKQAKDCTCIEELNEQMRSDTGDPEASLELSIGLNGNCYPYMSVVYRRKGKGGDYGVREYHKTVIPTYCPFCGRKYKVTP